MQHDCNMSLREEREGGRREGGREGKRDEGGEGEPHMVEMDFHPLNSCKK